MAAAWPSVVEDDRHRDERQDHAAQDRGAPEEDLEKRLPASSETSA